jgi:DNA-binding PadR family transcriptional regulator
VATWGWPSTTVPGQELEKTVEMRTRYMVLLLLAEGPKTGYEIIKKIRDLLAEIGGGASPGTVYPVLRRLEEEGYIFSIDDPHGGRQRKIYRITSRGIEYLMRSAERALNALDIAMRLHLLAVKGIHEPARLTPEMKQLLRSIAEKLKSIKARTEELIELVEYFISKNTK